ncbi:Coenzyme F420 hydrogenase/dehydrogenase, beta subunit C-terminal domain [Halorarum halophilum]|uniref:Coenzyme F420 hydrogenase/dehydrogenase, beta subunit C-terminal domain n=1 Tax=Halorarum halophilum TaxID=2743090 RepID=A0A7D5KUM0_9EURY|nr:Coenzyme F420 hydrogenase/dehydrogenase, beta subunit C-terminal domain [Halobaculum halophilum]QLG27660.1 Coenzyme F420 hydrogenase/dehydrogenase, beta subunit C-terminal domain [Halobaculum halophilum]
MTDGQHREECGVNAPADAAPELVEDAVPNTASDEDETADQPLPRIPESGGTGDEATVPPTSGGGGRGGRTDHSGHERTDAKPIRFYRGEAERDGGERGDETGTADGASVCGCGGSCGCDGADERAGIDDGRRTAAPDGGARPANVDGEGNLGDLSFTEPGEGRSQDLSTDRPDRRVGVPDGIDLDTPGYAIRDEMNDIETPDGKTWFMELDAAVIDEGRCIQCGTCVASCPSDSIGIGDDGLPELVKMCTGCSLCWDFCPRGGLRYERQWKITGGEDNVKGAGDPITEFSAKVEESWRENAQDGGLVTSVLIHLLEAGEIDGALVATESEEEPWKAESFLATTPEELIANAGSFYNQTMALGNVDVDQWAEKLPETDPEDLSLALVGTPCEIEGIRALQDFDWDYASQEAGVRAADYTIALMCTKNFNYERLVGEQLAEKRDIQPEEIGKLDVLHGDMIVYDDDGDLLLEEDIEEFHGAALKGCDECADFTGYCADLTVGSVGSSDEYSSVIVRTERGLKAWELTEPDLDYHDLEDRSAVGGLQSWDKKKAFESLERPFDPDAPRFIEYTEHAERYGTELNPHEADH